MKMYDIVMWLIIFNGVLGLLGTVDPFNINDNPTIQKLPSADAELEDKLTNIMALIEHPDETFGIFSVLWTWLNIGGQMFIWIISFALLSVTYLPSLLLLLGVPPALVSLISVITLVVTAIGIWQLISGKWIPFGK